MVGNGSVTKTWLRAIELTAPITRHPWRVLPIVIEELADEHGDAPALLSDRECLTYRALAERSNRYARWALAERLSSGDTVCLLMPNRPEYMAIWLGITRVGGVVALLNPSLTGRSLEHCINLVSPRHVIVAAELADSLSVAKQRLTRTPQIWVHGPGCEGFPRIDCAIEQQTAEPLNTGRPPPTIEDRALYIYTSGTTGPAKAAVVSHYRLMLASHWFAGLMDVQPNDRMYNCLPMHHIVGGVQATGAVLVSGGSVVVSEKFSARRFWNDVSRWDCTLFQYIGELCRYLMHAERHPLETEHRLRMCCGNGLGADVWSAFETRFRIPRILEFYGATEGQVSLFNVEGKSGAIGRIPLFLAHRFPMALVKCDVETETPLRDASGFCIRCGPNEVGEAISPLDPSNLASRFDGYSSKEATEKKLLRSVFRAGDAWYRTGDLMRKDEKGYFYFVDRIGDTFRWKGENVSTSEVSEAIRAFPGVKEANVYGVKVPGTDGRAGMATLVIDDDLDLSALRRHLIDHLPRCARPLFLRVRNEMPVTATFKYEKSDLVQEGFDPATRDFIYFDDQESGQFVRLDQALYDRFQAGQVRA
jgi:fatty-acyl-CoA synthase